MHVSSFLAVEGGYHYNSFSVLKSFILVNVLILSYFDKNKAQHLFIYLFILPSECYCILRGIAEKFKCLKFTNLPSVLEIIFSSLLLLVV